jgi:hypothetical protein
MLKGKKKGFQKVEARISDETIAPYYITVEECQYTVMIEGSTIPQGYYGSLDGALRKIAHYKNLETINQSTVTLNEYLQSYKDTVNIISQAIK